MVCFLRTPNTYGQRKYSTLITFFLDTFELMILETHLPPRGFRSKVHETSRKVGFIFEVEAQLMSSSYYLGMGLI